MALIEDQKGIPAMPRLYLIKYREERRLTISEISKRLDISYIYYYYIESGRRGHHMNTALISKIINILEVDAKEFLNHESKYQECRKDYLEKYMKKRLAKSASLN